MQQPKARIGDLILTTDGEIIGYDSEGFQRQLCVVRKIHDRADQGIPATSPRRFTYLASTLSDGREVELFGDEFEVASREEQADAEA